ncbi:MAG: hypothetical protein ACLGH4_10280, partial [Actinomycetes bacterium]
RTGGLTPDLFPTPEQLAAVIAAALDREVRFKCTAGLHRAVRHDEPGTGRHHGFLNVWLATRASLDGADEGEVAALLASEDAEALRERAAAAGDQPLAGARRWFRSFGSCSVVEPLEDLVALGLLGAAWFAAWFARRANERDASALYYGSVVAAVSLAGLGAAALAAGPYYTGLDPTAHAYSATVWLLVI